MKFANNATCGLVASCRFYRLLNMLQQTRQSHKVATSLLKSGLLKFVFDGLVLTRSKTTCSRSVENCDSLQQMNSQAMRTHADIKSVARCQQTCCHLRALAVWD